MQDIESLRDYFIADEIQRIQSLTQEELVKELVELHSKRLESLQPEALVDMCRIKNEN